VLNSQKLAPVCYWQTGYLFLKDTSKVAKNQSNNYNYKKNIYATKRAASLNAQVNDSKFPKLSGRVREIKTTEGGATSMCELMKKYNREAVLKDNARTVGMLIKRRNMTFDEACDFLFIPVENKEFIKNFLTSDTEK
jgi:pyruvate-formate lyase